MLHHLNSLSELRSLVALYQQAANSPLENVKSQALDQLELGSKGHGSPALNRAHLHGLIVAQLEKLGMVEFAAKLDAPTDGAALEQLVSEAVQQAKAVVRESLPEGMAPHELLLDLIDAHSPALVFEALCERLAAPGMISQEAEQLEQLEGVARYYGFLTEHAAWRERYVPAELRQVLVELAQAPSRSLIQTAIKLGAKKADLRELGKELYLRALANSLPADEIARVFTMVGFKPEKVSYEERLGAQQKIAAERSQTLRTKLEAWLNKGPVTLAEADNVGVTLTEALTSMPLDEVQRMAIDLWANGASQAWRKKGEWKAISDRLGRHVIQRFGHNVAIDAVPQVRESLQQGYAAAAALALQDLWKAVTDKNGVGQDWLTDYFRLSDPGLRSRTGPEQIERIKRAVAGFWNRILKSEEVTPAVRDSWDNFFKIHYAEVLPLLDD